MVFHRRLVIYTQPIGDSIDKIEVARHKACGADFLIRPP